MKKSKHKKQKEKHQPIVTAKKHWIVYIIPTLFIIAGIILLNSEEIFFQLAGLAVMFFGFYRGLKKANEKWHLTDQYVVMEKGILPWFKKYEEVHVHEIYKTHTDATKLSKYVSGLGNLNTRRRTDNCSGFSHSYIANPEQFSQALQMRVQSLPSHNLNQVYELKEKGAISEKEYNLIKLGHITQQHLSKL